MRYLLDPGACIAAMRHHPLPLHRLAAVAPGDCAIISHTASDLHTGVARCATPAKEPARVCNRHGSPARAPWRRAASARASTDALS